MIAKAAWLWPIIGQSFLKQAVSGAQKLGRDTRKTAGKAAWSGRHVAARLTGTRREPEPLKGLLAGIAGGLAGSFAMNQFHKLMSWADEQLDQKPAEERGEEEKAAVESGKEDAPATVKAAEAVSEGVLGHELTGKEAEYAGPAMHYAFGSSVGAAYGLLAEYQPDVTYGFGMPFGTAVWIGADEIAVPVFGLADPPTEYPLSTHVSALGAHLVYGVVTELVRRTIRDAW